MFVESIPLRFGRDRRIARMREITGRDEYSIGGIDTANAIELLAKLLDTSSAFDSETLRAVDLVAADRDRLLAAIYKRAFGDRIESTITCARCREPFDLDFSLDRLIESIKPNDSGEWSQLADGQFRSANGISFRLPTGNDEIAAIGLTAEQVESLLLSRCLQGGEWPEGETAFEDLLEEVAPLIDLELVATCPECNHVQAIQFEIQSYLLGALITERRRLLSDINCIAAAYSWSLDEILSLTRSDRRHLVDLIENENAA